MLVAMASADEMTGLPVLGDPEDHPRPQLTRPYWQDLSGPWDFAFDDDVVGITEQWQRRPEAFDRTIEVPFPFESAASGIGDTGFHPVIWYQRSFAARLGEGRRLLLHFGAVDYRAHVWVNGHAVAFHEGGNTPFTADITSVLNPSGHQVVVVRVEDNPFDLRQPRGKQDWQRYPHAIWYDRTSGIWQTVWVEDVPVARVHSVHWRPDVDRRSLDLRVKLRLDSRPGLRLRVVLRLGTRVLADDTYSVDHADLERRITLTENDMSLGHSELLWSPEQPHLIAATLTLLDEDGPVDEVRSYTALRSITASRDRLMLNGRPYYLRPPRWSPSSPCCRRTS